MNHLSDRMVGKKGEMQFENYAQWMADPYEARLYTESQHSGSIGPAKSLAKHQKERLLSCTNVLDVGGGSGGFSITLAEKFPNLKLQVSSTGRVFARVPSFPSSLSLANRTVVQSFKSTLAGASKTHSKP